jgi:hypothetical protein
MNLLRAVLGYIRAWVRHHTTRCPHDRWSAPAPDGFCLACGRYRKDV